MKWLIGAGLTAFISTNSKIFFRVTASTLLISLGNLLYTKFEALLLATNPDKLFIPLYTFTALTISLILWTLVSLKSLKSLSESRRVNEVRQSYKDKPISFAELADIHKYPNLKSRSDKILKK